jgi:hypothetical protein
LKDDMDAVDGELFAGFFDLDGRSDQGGCAS